MKKTIRLTESELISIIKKSIKEQDDTYSNFLKSNDFRNCRKERLRVGSDGKTYCTDGGGDAELEKFNEYINPKKDVNGDKLDKSGWNEFKEEYKSFLQKHPEFEKEQSSKLKDPMQRYSFIKKLAINTLSKDTLYWVVIKLNKFLGREKKPEIAAPITEDEMYEIVNKMGGWDKFVQSYNEGFPQIQ